MEGVEGGSTKGVAPFFCSFFPFYGSYKYSF